jgi:RNA polymerase sigma-70 factor (ECF subfamily)
MTYSANIEHPAEPESRRGAGQGTGSEGEFERELLPEIPHLQNYALSLTKDPSEASDLVQGCILRALEKQEQFSSGTHMRRWLFTILRNRYLDGWRQIGRRGPHVPLEECRPLDALGQPGAQDDWIELRECERRLREVRPMDRIILLLSVFSALSHKEIADRLGIAEGTVRSRLSRTRADLRS